MLKGLIKYLIWFRKGNYDFVCGDIAERDELSGKLAKLTEFINSVRFTEIVPDELERDRLILQKSIMTAYLDVLNHRIDAFK